MLTVRTSHSLNSETAGEKTTITRPDTVWIARMTGNKADERIWCEVPEALQA